MNKDDLVLYNPKRSDIPDGWELVKIGDRGEFVAGGTPSTRKPEYWEGGNYPWMRSGDIHQKRIFNVEGKITKLGLENSSATLLPIGSVLVALAGQGKTRGTVAVNEIKLCTNQSVAAIIVDESIDYKYLYVNLDARYENLRRFSTGDGGRGGLNLSILRNIWITLPPLREQQKIAQILSTWDEAIAITENLIDALEKRKKGLMQRLLTGATRFPGYTEEWDYLLLTNLFQRVTRKVGNREVKDFLSISASIGFENQIDKFGKIIAGNSAKNYTLLRKGEFAYNRGNSKSYPQGCIYLLEDYQEAAVPNVYYCFTPNCEAVIPEFYKYYFENGLLNQQLMKLISSSARSDGLVNISASDFFDILVPLPSMKEQRTISSLFLAIDKELDLYGSQLDFLTIQKKGLIQRLLTGQVRVKVEE